MKKAILASIIISTSLFMANEQVSAKAFTDVSSNHWAKQEITYLVDNEIIKGCADNQFCASQPITRAEAATMIMRYFGWNATGQPNPGYSDLSDKHWAYNDIVTLYEMDIFAPSSKLYQPNKALTRGEMADILVKTFQLTSIKANPFTDVTRDDAAYKAIQIVASNGISSGYPDGSFKPNASVTRAEFAVFMSRAMEERFKLEDKSIDAEGLIYELEINNEYIQLKNPLVLREQWYAPLELFERLGYGVQNLSGSSFILSNPAGSTIKLAANSNTIWVDEVSATVDDPIIFIDGNAYIAAHRVIEALEQKLVFYPEDFVIALEQPDVTNSTILQHAPQTAIAAIHDAQPYWKWTKRDEDYMTLVHLGQKTASNEELKQQMEQLTKAYETVAKEAKQLRGLTYYGIHTNGKLDAISRALEARYLQLYDQASFAYPELNKSYDSILNSDAYLSYYTIQDYNYQDFSEQEAFLLETVNQIDDLPIESLKGLSAFSIPFTITDISGSTPTSYAGLALGDREMYVVNAGLGTFLHEFGHNWDAKFGDEEAYLAIRNKSNYKPVSNDWENLVGENFAEDFANVFYPKKLGEYSSKAVFGTINEKQAKELYDFVQEQTKTSVDAAYASLNGITVLPDVWYAKDGKVTLDGSHIAQATIEVEGLTNSYKETVEWKGQALTYQFPEKGAYKLVFYDIAIIIVY